MIINNTRNEPESGNYPPGITADSVNALMKAEPAKPDTIEKDTVILKIVRIFLLRSASNLINFLIGD
ncbi:MAG: hypothetical protein IPN18_12830 [Ignavibacteriales bacterium]|nr:hypothetical protein [Ignavibacteriales bacterium]